MCRVQTGDRCSWTLRQFCKLYQPEQIHQPVPVCSRSGSRWRASLKPYILSCKMQLTASTSSATRKCSVCLNGIPGNIQAWISHGNEYSLKSHEHFCNEYIFFLGGLVCRGILSTLPDHNVHSFISLSSPQAGQYGDTDYLKYLFPQFVKSNLYHVCYTSVGQRISICNYWNGRRTLKTALFHDEEPLKNPHHRDMYINSSDYMALLNSERANPNTTVWKENFLRIKKLVLIGGPDDGVITPWQSSQFGFYDDNETVVELKNQKVFLMDSFGLKTLYARGDLALCSVAGVTHILWHSNETVYKNCIEKWLT
ncbi:lysosomal thioesterase PPT2-A-like isoform X3 [Myxocyprinus asiaticus]|uniref:lysosomal thioesterase PPT2-A-like isoform X3 n=1 Tax=Myxocyprinus asiaticus TaxID=70543 RepID=UPI002223C986|nr:lysosomal thioesterase PPT2-A-like isoform X3 [Myxocyprinus asiaticus]